MTQSNYYYTLLKMAVIFSAAIPQGTLKLNLSHIILQQE